jgi:hypothetical protein
MDVRHTHTTANAVKKGGDDGDMHFSGVSNDVGLPFVAEIVNAGLPAQQTAVAAIIAKQKNGQPARIRGAWRFWFEHPAKKQTQGGNNPFSPDHTNPDHSFEIHPISHVDQQSVTASFIPIKGYTAYTADVAFDYFDKSQVVIKGSSSGVTIRSKKLVYNYVEFRIELAAAPKKVSDGYIALASVLNDAGDPAANGTRRMIFVDGTKAAQKISTAAAGDRFRVLGIPRINLNALMSLVKQNGTKQFSAQLPYEMIIVGIIQ